MYTLILQSVLNKNLSYPGEENSFVWNVDQIEVSISFTNNQKLASEAHINGIHLIFWKRKTHVKIKVLLWQVNLQCCKEH